MTLRKKSLLVVDASVVRLAGETEHPMSSSCRECLESIRLICHHVALTPPVWEEWKRHMSRFSRKWLRSMAARKKHPETVILARVPLDMRAYPTPAREQIEKDLCLLQAALAADRILVTRDDRLKVALEQRPDGVVLLRSIRWINPVQDGAKAIEGL